MIYFQNFEPPLFYIIIVH